MNTHYNDCDAVLLAIGRLQRASRNGRRDKMISKPSRSNLKHLITDRLSSEANQELDLGFAHAMNTNGLPF